MENKLIPMTDFTINQNKDGFSHVYSYHVCLRYAQFLKQTLTLGMFVPCDESGKPYDLEEVFAWNIHKDYSRFHKEELAFFNDAKEKVLFEGFEFVESFDKYRFVLRQKGQNQVWAEMTKTSGLYFRFPNLYTSTVEDLICSVDIELTETALKQIGISK